MALLWSPWLGLVQGENVVLSWELWIGAKVKP